MNATATITLDQLQEYEARINALNEQILSVKDERINFLHHVIDELKAENARLEKEVARQRHNAEQSYDQWRVLTESFTEADSGDYIVIAEYNGATCYSSYDRALEMAIGIANEGQKTALVSVLNVVDIPRHEMTREDEIAYQEEWKNTQISV